MVYRSAQKRCPRCGLALVNEVAGPREFLRCESCYGVFLEHRTLKDMLSQMGAVGPLVLSPPSGNETELPCPMCSKPMAKGVAFHMPIDACTHDHGLWFDRNELEKALAGAGGVDTGSTPVAEATLLQQLMRDKL